MNSQHVNLSELGFIPARAMVSATARVRAVVPVAAGAAARYFFLPVTALIVDAITPSGAWPVMAVCLSAVVSCAT
jgi:hypothetical protein